MEEEKETGKKIVEYVIHTDHSPYKRHTKSKADLVYHIIQHELVLGSFFKEKIDIEGETLLIFSKEK